MAEREKSWYEEKQDNDNFGSSALRFFGGPFSSLKEAQMYEDQYEEALGNISTKGPELDLSNKYAKQAEMYNRQFQGAPEMSSAADNAAYIQSLNQALGIQGANDFRSSQQAALQQGLDQQAFNQSVRDQSMMQQTGNLGGGQALALGNLTRNDIASGRIQGNLAIEQDYANRAAQERAQALGYGQHADQYGMEGARLGSTNLQNQINNALGLQNDLTGRQMQEFQYNELMPYQAETAKQMAMADALNQKAGQAYAVRGSQVQAATSWIPMMGGKGGGGGQQQAAPAQSAGANNPYMQNAGQYSGSNLQQQAPQWGQQSLGYY